MHSKDAVGELAPAEYCVTAAAGKGCVFQSGLRCAPADLALVEDACHNGALCHCNQAPAQRHAPGKSFPCKTHRELYRASLQCATSCCTLPL